MIEDAGKLPDLSDLLRTYGEGRSIEPVVLENGLVVLVKELHSAPVVTAQVYVAYRNELKNLVPTILQHTLLWDIEAVWKE